MIYNIFLWIHIVSYIIWLAVFVASLFFRNAIYQAFGTDREKLLVKKERKISGLGGHIAIAGILISGGVMVSIPSGPQWGWFPFSTFAWLAFMQAIFAVILIVVFSGSIPRGIKLKKLLRAVPEDKLTAAQRTQWRKCWNTSLVVYLLVVAATLLGWFRP